MSKAGRKVLPIPFFLFVGIVAISFSAIFVKWSAAPASVIAMYRLLMTNVLMLPLLWKYRAELKHLSFASGLKLFASGIALGLHFLLWMDSLRFTTVASSTALLTLEPIFVMLGSFWAFKQRTGAGAVLGMLIAIAGAVLIGWGDFQFSGPALKGDVLSLLGTLAVAIHMLLGKSLRSQMSAYVYSFFVFFVAGSVLALYNLFAGYAIAGYPPKEWGVFLLLAVVPTIFGHALFNWLLKYLKATSVSMTVLGEPLGATVLAYFLLGEQVSGMQVAAGLLLLFGIWLFLRSNEPAHPAVREKAA
jgi:drug/metabolite transporter (DMT)-like permease